MRTFRAKQWVGAIALAFGVFTAPLAMAAKDVTVAVQIALDSLDPYNTNSTLAQAVGKAYYE